MSSTRPIRILSAELANQIAAGEVVERPASVVKELVENSLDANASEILVEIVQGGIKKILIRDNGDGIEKSQLELALSRHATSKIESIQDLEQIKSMGFRGEALASISSVSRLTLCSKPDLQDEAWQAHAEGQQMDIVVKPAAHPKGTSIEVLDLFFNTPARRKFLKTPKTEFQHIETLVKRLALTNPHVKFSLIHNGKRCLNLYKAEDHEKRIEQVCGKSFVQDCAQVNYRYESIQLTGLTSKLGKGSPTRDYQYTFVNGRIMKDKLIAHALRQAYEETLPAQTFPAYVLYLTLPPDELDINVHPAKHEVRFHQSRHIHDLVFKAITETLGMSKCSESDQPKHDYIVPLQKQSTNIYTEKQAELTKDIAYKASAENQKILSGKQTFYNPKPSNKELAATRNFYSSVKSSNLSTRVIEDAIQKSAKQSSEVQSNVGEQSCIDPQESHLADCNIIYNPPFVVLNDPSVIKAPSLKLVHITELGALVIRQQIELSTASQTLLMPVSRIANQTDKTIFDHNDSFFKHWNFEFVLNHNKVILKKVPSTTRQLPWASIIGKLSLAYNLESQSSDTNEFLLNLSFDIANAWVDTSMPDQAQVSQWLSYLNTVDLNNLIKQTSVTIDLQQVWQKMRGDSGF